MTNKLLLLAAAGTLAFASCQNENTGGMTDEVMQAKVDSAVQSKMAEMQAQLAASNDSLINAIAMMKADSMMAANAASNVPVRRTTPTRPSTTAPTAPSTPSTPATANDKESKFDRKTGATTGTATKEETADKKNKFDRKAGNN